jgi:acyl-Coa thioesterase superfamily protein/acyl-CoA thioesterase superfamily protein
VHSLFYEPDGVDEFVATRSTIGPWSADAQHAGPPSALAARLLAACEPVEGQRLASVAVDILSPVPVGRLTARSRVVRPGRRVSLAETVLSAGGRDVLHARGWRLATADRSAEAAAAAAAAGTGAGNGDGRPPALPGPQPSAPVPGAVMDGYMSAIEWRYVHGEGLAAPGPAAVWARPLVPLLPGEELSPMSRALLIGDSGNGISALLDPARYLFLNVDLRVSLHRDPEGEWLLLDAESSIGPSGTGLAASTLSDAAGPVGRGLQTLVVAPR